MHVQLYILLQSLVAKPDQLIKRRGKLGLVGINKTIGEVREWLEERMDKQIQIDAATGKLNTFIVEPFLPHEQSDEFYVCIYATRSGNTILFHHEGGVEIGDVESKAKCLEMDIEDSLNIETVMPLISEAPREKKR